VYRATLDGPMSLTVRVSSGVGGLSGSLKLRSICVDCMHILACWYLNCYITCETYAERRSFISMQTVETVLSGVTL